MTVLQVKDAKTGDFVLDRETPPGVYQYKFIVDGEWHLAAHPAQDMKRHEKTETGHQHLWQNHTEYAFKAGSLSRLQDGRSGVAFRDGQWYLCS